MLCSTGSILTSYNGSLFPQLPQIPGFWVGSILPQSPLLLLLPAQPSEQGRRSGASDFSAASLLAPRSSNVVRLGETKRLSGGCSEAHPLHSASDRS